MLAERGGLEEFKWSVRKFRIEKGREKYKKRKKGRSTFPSGPRPS